MKYSIPDYLAKRLIRSLLLLKERGEFDRSDIKVANALRCINKDCSKLQRIIDNQTNEHDRLAFNTNKSGDSDSQIAADMA